MNLKKKNIFTQFIYSKFFIKVFFQSCKLLSKKINVKRFFLQRFQDFLFFFSKWYSKFSESFFSIISNFDFSLVYSWR